MLLQDITRIVRVLLTAFDAVASQDALTQRRIGQIGEVIGAVEDVAAEEEQESTIAGKRVAEAHDIIHRVAAILAMEEDENEVRLNADGDDGGGEEPLAEEPWDGTLEGETIELVEDAAQ